MLPGNAQTALGPWRTTNLVLEAGPLLHYGKRETHTISARQSRSVETLARYLLPIVSRRGTINERPTKRPGDAHHDANDQSAVARSEHRCSARGTWNPEGRSQAGNFRQREDHNDEPDMYSNV